MDQVDCAAIRPSNLGPRWRRFGQNWGGRAVETYRRLGGSRRGHIKNLVQRSDLPGMLWAWGTCVEGAWINAKTGQWSVIDADSGDE